MRNENSNIQERSLNAIAHKGKIFFLLKFSMCAFKKFFVGNFSEILTKRLILFMIFL